MSANRRETNAAVIERPAAHKPVPKRKKSPHAIIAAVATIAVLAGAIAYECGNLALGDSYRKLDAGDAVGAVTSARTAVALMPHNVDALDQLGKSLSRTHDHAAAYAVYARAHSSFPDDADAFMGMCHEGLFPGVKLDPQRQALSDWIDAHPTDGRAMLILGQTYERLLSSSDNEQQAITWEERAEQANTGDEETEMTLAARFVSVNQPLNALRYYSAGLLKTPDSAPLLRGALVCYDQIGQTGDAADAAERLKTAKEMVDDIPPFKAPQPIVPTTGPSTVAARFVDVAAAAGLRHNFRMVVSKPQNILQTIGSGCAFLDFNDDGNLDILLVDHQPALYEGDGQGHFVDKTAEVGFDKVHGYFLGCAVGDFDNDGFDDIVLTGYNAVALLKNDAGKQLVDVSAASGLNATGWNSCAAFGDIDNDGKLDLYICRYEDFKSGVMGLCLMEGTLSGCGPNKFDPQRGTLYRNLGGGKFADVTAQWGATGTAGKGLGAAFADFNGTGRQSLCLANDQVPRTLYATTGTRFAAISRSSGTSVREDGKGFSGMGIDWGDYDNDGKLDLAAMAFQWEDKRILHNDGNGLFSQSYAKLGMSKSSYPWVSFGMKWFDFDNDGWLDMVYSTGHTDDNIQERQSDLTFLEPTMLYHNENGQQLVDHSAGLVGPARRSIEGRGLAIGDYENNGKVDVLVVDSSGQPLLLHNETAGTGHWLDITLVGTKSNRDGYGAKVIALAGELRQTRYCHADGSYLSSSDKRVHIGLGDAATIDSLEIHWPSGAVDKLANVTVDRVMTVVEGKGLGK